MLNKPAKVSMLYILTNLCSKGAAFFLLPLFTHRLSSEEYSLYALFTGWEAVITVFAACNLTGGSLFRGLQKNRERSEEYCSSLLLLLFGTVGISFLFYFIFHRKITEASNLPTEIWGLLFADILGNAIVNLYAGFQRYRYRAGYPVISSLMLSVFSPLLAYFLLIFLDIRAESRIYAATAVSLLTAAVPAMRLLKKVRSVTVGQLLQDIRSALRLSLPMLPNTLGLMLLAGGDKLLLRRLCSASELGKYALAYSCAMALSAVGNGLISALSPWIMRKNAAKENGKIREMFSAASSVLLPLILLFLCLIPEIFGFLAPSSYQDALPVVYPIALAIFPMFLSNLATQAGMIYDRPLLFSLPSVIGAAVNLGLNLLLLPKSGYLAAGCITLLSYSVYCLFSLFLLSAKSEQSVTDGKKLLADFVLSIGAAWLLFLTRDNFAFRAGFGCALTLLLFYKLKSGFSLLREKPLAGEIKAPS